MDSSMDDSDADSRPNSQQISAYYFKRLRGRRDLLPRQLGDLTRMVGSNGATGSMKGRITRATVEDIEWQVACDVMVTKACHEIRSNSGYYGAGGQFIAGRPLIAASNTRALTLAALPLLVLYRGDQAALGVFDSSGHRGCRSAGRNLARFPCDQGITPRLSAGYRRGLSGRRPALGGSAQPGSLGCACQAISPKGGLL